MNNDIYDLENRFRQIGKHDNGFEAYDKVSEGDYIEAYKLFEDSSDHKKFIGDYLKTKITAANLYLERAGRMMSVAQKNLHRADKLLEMSRSTESKKAERLFTSEVEDSLRNVKRGYSKTREYALASKEHFEDTKDVAVVHSEADENDEIFQPLDHTIDGIYSNVLSSARKLELKYKEAISTTTDRHEPSFEELVRRNA